MLEMIIEEWINTFGDFDDRLYMDLSGMTIKEKIHAIQTFRQKRTKSTV